MPSTSGSASPWCLLPWAARVVGAREAGRPGIARTPGPAELVQCARLEAAGRKHHDHVSTSVDEWASDSQPSRSAPRGSGGGDGEDDGDGGTNLLGARVHGRRRRRGRPRPPAPAAGGPPPAGGG